MICSPEAVAIQLVILEKMMELARRETKHEDEVRSLVESVSLEQP